MVDPRPSGPTGQDGEDDAHPVTDEVDADPRTDAEHEIDSERESDSERENGTEREIGGDGDATGPTPSDSREDRPTAAELRRRVEAAYDFENFTPADMDRMSVDEWEVAFDADTWITGPDLLDRVERDLRRRVADRDVFAAVERVRMDGEERVLAYSDEGYALIHGDGTVEGFGTVLRDVEPTVALCAMDDYEPEEPPEDGGLPHPDEVSEGRSELGNWMLQLLGAVHLLAAVALFAGAIVLGLRDSVVLAVAGLFFLIVGVLMFVLVANARLSDAFRAAEYRARLRSIGVGSDERPAFLPVDEESFLSGGDEAFEAGGDEAFEAGGERDERRTNHPDDSA